VEDETLVGSRERLGGGEEGRSTLCLPFFLVDFHHQRSSLFPSRSALISISSASTPFLLSHQHLSLKNGRGRSSIVQSRAQQLSPFSSSSSFCIFLSSFVAISPAAQGRSIHPSPTSERRSMLMIQLLSRFRHRSIHLRLSSPPPPPPPISSTSLFFPTHSSETKGMFLAQTPMKAERL